MPDPFDLVVRGATLRGEAADIGVRDGRIAQIGGDLTGWRVQGWPRFVIGRGQVLLADGELTARPGQGQWLRRGRATAA
jgi:hypothetical protein